VASICSADTQSVKEKREGTEATLCGILSVVKELTTKKGDRMAFLSLEDKEGILEVISFSDTFLQARPLLEGDEPLVVIGKIQHDEKGSKILAERILTLDEAQVQTVDSVSIRLQADRLDRDGLTRLRHLLMNHPGDCKTFLHLIVRGKGEAVIALSSKLHVKPTRSFFEEMSQHFGTGCVEASYKACQQATAHS
jgi:DNA polymerase-3 subunit alpha